MEWEKALWHLSNQRFACKPDAHAALAQQLTPRPEWLTVHAQLVPHPKQHRPGRPRQGTLPDRIAWPIQATVSVDAVAVPRAVQRTAAVLVATTVLEPAHLADQELIQTDNEQHRVARGVRFRNDPLFLASSVFVNKPERIVALSLVMMLCLLVYRLAEHRRREQLAATGQTVPNHLKHPTARPTMRWIVPCFEGISLVAFQPPQGPPHLDLAWVWLVCNRCTCRWLPSAGRSATSSTQSMSDAAQCGLSVPGKQTPTSGNSSMGTIGALC